MELTALRCSFVQTSTASQFTKHARFDARAHPATAPPQAQPAGGGQPNIQTTEQPNIHSGHRCARLGPRSAWRLRPRERGRAKQRPVWMFFPLCPSGCAEERRVWRIRARVCLSDAQRRELSETPPNPSTAGCPVAKRRGRRQWGRPFFGSFLSATRKKGTRLPGDSRPPPSMKACHSMRTSPQTQRAKQTHEAVNFRRPSPVP